MKKSTQMLYTLGDFCRRTLILGMATVVFSSILPIELINSINTSEILKYLTPSPKIAISAESEGYRANPIATANATINVDEGSTVDVEVKTDVKVNANHRSLVILDAGKISNTNNIYLSDYKPKDLKKRILDILPEYKFADILEYSDFDNEPYEDVYIREDKSRVKDYAYKLEYLIKNNIINRTTDFVYDETGVYEGMDRFIHPAVTEDSTQSEIAEQSEQAANEIAVDSGANKPRYWDPSLRISKTDFLVELMKIAGPKESRIIATQSKYTRLNEKLQTTQPIQEPVELSPYQRNMGELGIDTANNDIVIDHKFFKQVNLMVTNDVTEAYLFDALNRGIIERSELGGDEGNTLVSILPTGTFSPPGSWYEKSPLRQFYTKPKSNSDDPDQVQQPTVADDSSSAQPEELHGKQIATDDDGNRLASYPKDLDQYLEVINESIDEAEIMDGLDYPWGNSFFYSQDACGIGNAYNNQATEIIKRFSCVDVDQGLFDNVRAQVTGEYDKGYRYFTDEDITLADAYVLTHKFMVANGEEPHINQQEIDYINSTYALDFTGLLADEIDAVQYLIAKGILDPQVESINAAASTQLTNDIAIDLLYRVANPNYRCSFTPTLTDEQISMLNRGYGQTTLASQTGTDAPSAEPIPINYTIDNSTGESLWTRVKNDRIKNSGNYDYIYIRLPEGIIQPDEESDTGYTVEGTARLIVDNSLRTQINTYNARLNGGIAEYMIPSNRAVDKDGNYLVLTQAETETYIPEPQATGTTPETTPQTDAQGEIIYKLKADDDDAVFTDLGEDLNNLTSANFVYRDFENNFWLRYIVHKDSSNKLRLIVTKSDNSVTQYDGFAGEGVYYLLKPTDTLFTKITVEDAEKNAVSNVQPNPLPDEETHPNIKNHTLYHQVIYNDIMTRRYLGKADIQQYITDTKSSLRHHTHSRPSQALQSVIPTGQDQPTHGKTRSAYYKYLISNQSPIISTRNQDGTYTQEQQIKLKTLFDEPKTPDGDTQMQGNAKIGPLDINTLKYLVLDYENLVDVSADEPKILVDNFTNKIGILPYVQNMSIEADTSSNNSEGKPTKWYIVYKPQGEEVATELGAVMQKLNTSLTAGGNTDIRIPGYAKFNHEGEEVVIVSKEEIQTWGQSDGNNPILNIKFVEGSDKVLYNANTGQRAFINTDEHFTMIGNNITRYSDDTILCNTFGGKVFYNLDALLELFGDVNAVASKYGTNVFVSTRQTNCMSESARYDLTDVMDNSTDITGNDATPPMIDSTWTLTDSGNAYVCLSSLSDKASNMIYFKDKTHQGLELLISYYPKVTDGVLRHSNSVNNGILASMTNSGGTQDSSSLITSGNDDFKDDTQILSAYLFSGGGGANLKKLVDGRTVAESASEVLPTGYQYDIYLLGTTSDNKLDASTWSDFVSVFQKTEISGRTGLDVLKNSIMEDSIKDIFKEAKENSNENYNTTNIKFKFLPTAQRADTATSKNSGEKVFRDLASNNLYFRIVNSDGTTNQFSYADYFKNRVYMRASKDENGNTVIDKKYNDITSPNARSCMLFSRQRYFYKTPEGMAPLEIYSDGRAVVGTLNKQVNSGTRKYEMITSGRFLNSADDKFPVQVINQKVNNKIDDGNMLVPFRSVSSTSNQNTGGDIAMFTGLRSFTTRIFSSGYESSSSSAASILSHNNTDDITLQSHLFDELADRLTMDISQSKVANLYGSTSPYTPQSFLDYFDYKMSGIFQTAYSSNSTTADSFKDSKGVLLWSPKVARDYVVYDASSTKKSTDTSFVTSLAEMYESTWAMLDTRDEEEFWNVVNKDTNNRVSYYFSNNFRSFSTVKNAFNANGTAKSDSQLDLFLVLTIGNAPTLQVTKGKATNAYEVLSNNSPLGSGTTLKDFSNLDYSSDAMNDDPVVAYVSLCSRNLEADSDVYPIVIGGITASQLKYESIKEGIQKIRNSLDESTRKYFENKPITTEEVMYYLTREALDFENPPVVSNKGNIAKVNQDDKIFCIRSNSAGAASTYLTQYKNQYKTWVSDRNATKDINPIDRFRNKYGISLFPKENGFAPFQMYYQPTYSVPAGTTVVTEDGKLRTFLSDKIRSEINYLSDINNSILAKYLLSYYANVTYLEEVPIGDKIVFTSSGGNNGSSTYSMYKVSEQQDIKDENGLVQADKLQWVPTLLYQSTDDFAVGSVSYNRVNDFALASKIYKLAYSIEMPTLSSQSFSNDGKASSMSSRVKLGSTLGNGMWRLPVGSEINSFYDKVSSYGDSGSLTQMVKEGVWVYPEEVFNKTALSTVLAGKLTEARGTTTSITANALKYTKKLFKFSIDTDLDIPSAVSSVNAGAGIIADKADEMLKGYYRSDTAKKLADKKAMLYPVMNLPPTIVVEPSGSETAEKAHTWEVKFYVNPEIFGMDMNNKYIAYLRQRDTSAEDIATALGQTRSSNFDGNMFKIKVFMKWMDDMLESMWAFIQYVIPLVLLILWLITTCLYGAVHYLSITNYMLHNLKDGLGFDIVEFVTLGVLGTDKVTPLSHYFIYSFLMWTTMMLLFSAMLQQSLVSVWTFFMQGL